ncbi:MAG: FAD-dependent oxidoreductase, partial [Spirochaetes bacterium]|nr:FAD-dependent oxidoreductase [Spirochaetota bacterium]
MANQTRIVVLGGGYAGIEAAKKLHKRYKKRQDVSITLIDRNPYHTLMTELHEIAGSRTEPEAVQINFHRIFAGTKVQVVIDEIEGIDFEKKQLKSDVASYDYDYLVLGTGGHPEFFGIPGIQQHSFTLWSLEDAIRIRE